MGNMEEAQDYLRQTLLPKLNTILDFADEVLAARAKEGEYTEEPSLHERFLVASLTTQLMGQAALAKVASQKDGEPAPPPEGPVLVHVDYREVEGPFKNMLADQGFDLSAWTHLEDLLAGTDAGQKMLQALVHVAYERNQREGSPPA